MGSEMCIRDRGGGNQYAAFEYDYAAKALKAFNLQAGEIFRVGESFGKPKVNIMPAQYDPKARRASQRWKGGAKKQCRKPQHRARCDAFATLLAEAGVVEALEWLLTARVGSAEAFSLCREQRRCKWLPKVNDKGEFQVSYHYQIEDQPEVSISWNIRKEPKEIAPQNTLATLAFRAVRARSY